MRMPRRILVPLCLILLASLQTMCGGEKISGPTSVSGPSPPGFAGQTAVGLWISAPELAALPESGPGWANVFNEAQQQCRTPRLSDQEDQGDVCLLSKALVYLRTGENRYRDEVVSALTMMVASPPYRGRALAPTFRTAGLERVRDHHGEGAGKGGAERPPGGHAGW